jgi:hypothetical protein
VDGATKHGDGKENKKRAAAAACFCWKKNNTSEIKEG